MDYSHQWIDGREVEWPLGKIVCVGRNYRDHALELNNEIPDRPLLFLKPATSAVALDAPWDLPSQPLHYETEISVLIGARVKNAGSTEALGAIAGLGLALDLTDRALQSALKAKGHPWERAKAFDHSAPLTSFLPMSDAFDLGNLNFSMTMNGQSRQRDSSSNMLCPIVELIEAISQVFTLLPGDVVLTGTPAGVGVLEPAGSFELQLNEYQWQRPSHSAEL